MSSKSWVKLLKGSLDFGVDLVTMTRSIDSSDTFAFFRFVRTV